MLSRKGWLIIDIDRQNVVISLLLFIMFIVATVIEFTV